MVATFPVLRRYDLPAAAVQAATERRLAGDWRGACAAVGVEVDATVVAAESRMLDDLLHLAPDLLRWHLFDGDLGLAPGVRLPLLLAHDATTGLALIVHSRVEPHARTRWPGSQPVITAGLPRLVLSVGTAPVLSRWDTSRHLWDARYAARLLQRLGGGDRTPFFHRDGRPVDTRNLPQTAPPNDDRAASAEWEDGLRFADPVAGCRAAGVDLDPAATALFTGPQALRPYLRMSLVVPAARDLLGAGGGSGTVVATRLPRRSDLALTLTLGEGADAVLRVAEWSHVQHLPAVPAAAMDLPWFVDPLRSGWLPATALHPLVRTAMFPDGPDEPYATAPGVQVPERIHVQCIARHYLRWHAGQLEPLNHTPDEVRREHVLRALGGETAGCLAVLDAWSARTGRLPRQIRTVARHMFLAASHGDTAEVNRLLDAGVDPRGVRGPQRRSLLHVAHLFGDVALIRRLRTAGVDAFLPDGHGYTAVRVAQTAGAPDPIIESLRSTATNESL